MICLFIYLFMENAKLTGCFWRNKERIRNRPKIIYKNIYQFCNHFGFIGPKWTSLSCGCMSTIQFVLFVTSSGAQGCHYWPKKIVIGCNSTTAIQRNKLASVSGLFSDPPAAIDLIHMCIRPHVYQIHCVSGAGWLCFAVPWCGVINRDCYNESIRNVKWLFF